MLCFFGGGGFKTPAHSGHLLQAQISSRVEIPKLDPSVAITKTISDTNLTDAISCNPYFVLIFSRFIYFQPRF